MVRTDKERHKRLVCAHKEAPLCCKHRLDILPLSLPHIGVLGLFSKQPEPSVMLSTWANSACTVMEPTGFEWSLHWEAISAKGFFAKR